LLGGSSGIGRGAIDLLCEYGAKAVCADISPPAEPLPSGAVFRKCDVSKWDDIKQLFRETRDLHGRIDIVCANAGINDKENLLKHDENEPNWDILEINLKGVLMSMSLSCHGI
jgi:NAD(P)-dependent dehydrogenase (short-subunit alcohol dehydrogenase family)